MKTTLILLTMSLCACSTVSKETYTERREFTYPKGTTPHLKHMYMHQDPEVRRAEPIQPVNQEYDYTQTGDVPTNIGSNILDVQNQNRLLYAQMVNKLLKDYQ
jgi:hypothetical protein